MPDMFAVVRAEALFASPLQGSATPGTDEIRTAVADTLRRFGVRGCAVRVAGEFGDHPETAVVRMAWAIAAVAAVYPSRVPAARAARPTPALRLAV
jgi:hypothetical protein